MPSAFLEDRGVVRVGGADARAFLQDLFTCDMTPVSRERAAYGALLTPQGKIVCDFLAGSDGEAFVLDAPIARTAEFAKRLRLYKLRAKVEIDDVSAALGVVAHGASEAGVPDPRDPALGAREIVARDGVERDDAEAAAYEAQRILCGVPKGGADFAYGDAFPHEANMDLLNGVDFKKGCYVGQEVVSRVEHRGTARKRIARVAFHGDIPAIGAALVANDVEIGIVSSATDGHALAAVRIDRLAEAVAAGAPILLDNRAVSLALPAPRR